MKRILLPAAVLVILLSSCVAQNAITPVAEPSAIESVEQKDETINIAGLFSFGMTEKQVTDTLLANGFSSEYFSGTDFYSLLDDGLHDDLDAGEHAFIFDASGALYSFWTSTAETALGFAPGDSTTKMTALYGTDYKTHNFELLNQYIYEYDFGEYFLRFYTKSSAVSDFDIDTITTWEVTRYSFEESLLGSKILLDEIGNSDIGLLQLGMPIDEVYRILEIIHPGEGYDFTGPGDTIADKIECEHFTFSYGDDLLLDRFYVRKGGFTTSKGLRIGDDSSMVDTLYGEDYEKFNGRIREYNMGEHIFRVDIDDGKVSSWAVLKKE